MDSSDVTAGQDGTALQYNNLRKDLILAKSVGGSETDAATITVDWSDATKGKIRDVTIAGDRTLAFSNPTARQFIVLRVIQGAGGSHLISAYPANVSFPFDIEPVLSTTEGDEDWLVFYCKVAGGTPTYIGFHSGSGI